MADFLERIAEAEARSRDLEMQLSDPAVGKEQGAIEKLGKRLGSLRPLIEVGARYKAAVGELDDPRLAEDVLERGDALLERAGADERMITAQVFDHASRLRSYALLARIRDSLRA